MEETNKNQDAKQEKETTSEEFTIDLKKLAKIKELFKFKQLKTKKSKFILTLCLIIIPIILSVWFRTLPARLPIAEEWAQNTVYNYFRNQIATQISQQYPNLPEINKRHIVNDEFQKFLDSNKDFIKQQIKALSQQYKEKLQDETGQTYLLAIDPYFYLRHAKHYLEKGISGTELIGGKYPVPEAAKIMYPNLDFSKPIDWDGQRMAPVGSPSRMSFHAYFIAYLHKIWSFFNKGQTLMRTSFYVPVILMSLATIPAFLIGRRFAGPIGGLVAAILVATNPFIMTRTAGGFSDTDSYNILFPLLITWLFLESFERKKLKQKFIFASITGFFVGVYSFAWGGWWYIFDFILAMMILYMAYLVIIKREFFTQKTKRTTILFIIFFVSSFIFTTLFTKSPYALMRALKAPIGFTKIKAVAETTVWPNIQTTVAELNPASLNTIMSSVGGKFVFLLGCIGVILSAFKKDEEGKPDIKLAILLIVWFAGTIYACTKGVRFILLFAPAFSVAFGVFAGNIYEYGSRWLKKGLHLSPALSKILILILIALILFKPVKAGYDTAYREVPSMNDAWYETLKKIDREAEPDAIVNSWWDFGHWFITIGNRKVTFDGAGQDRHMAYWIGRVLYTDDPDLAIGILRMVDCGNNNAFWVLNEKLNDTPKSIEILNKIVKMDKDEAKKELLKYLKSEKDAESVLKWTHCKAPPNYFITSEDMIGKSGVWAHFGSWNFKRAAMYYYTHKLDKEEGIKLLKTKFNLTEDEAERIFYEIKTEDPNKWISGWPSYIGNSYASCKIENNITVKCANGLEVNLKTYNAFVLDRTGKPVHPAKLAYVDKKTKKFKIKTFKNNTMEGIAAALIPKGNNTYESIFMSPELAGSMFTRLFFFKGIGLEDKFTLWHEARQLTGGMIYVWKAEW